MNTVDARGRACPEPVVMTKKALEADPDGAVVLVDNVCAVENITRYASNSGYRVAKEERGDDYCLTVSRK